MDYAYLADLLFPDIKTTPEDMEKRYPPRNLPEGAMVTRFAPSPTGFMHLGNLFGALADERLAHQSGGIFYLRIEDTDQKREIEGAVETIITVLEKFGLKFDEGATIDGERGDYGPYRQSHRAEIYHTFAKELVRRGKAYPCFCTEEDMSKLRERQEAEKVNTGYYGKWAVCRNLSIEEIEKHLKAGDPYVIRFRSEGNSERRVRHVDCIKGVMEFPEHDRDDVILKSDGLPTYHFAHVVDDHLMRTTHVIRGEEWLSTLPYHLQLFEALGWKPPLYGHTAQMMKMDGGSKRKLSKRKDPEFALEYYQAEGYPVPSVIEYLMTLLNSNFEEWRLANPTLPVSEFRFSIEKMGVSGALFDLNKLRDISKNVVAFLTAQEVYDYVAEWAKNYDREFYELLAADPDYAKEILSIGRGGPKPRKDIAVWSEVKHYMAFFYDPLFEPGDEFPEKVPKEDAVKVLRQYQDIYDPVDDNDVWFGKIKDLTASLGYSPDIKAYKKNPGAYKGHVGDISAVLRVAVTGRANSPDLYLVMKILGRERVVERLKKAAERLEGKA